ncbi:MAG: four helix bundle protein [Dehalococcoidia bacterium]|nr:four helix bundle protein [Dehalococcoidia bacterium]
MVRKMEVGRGKKDAAQPADRGFRKLVVWQKADELASAVFQTLQKLPCPPWLQSQVARAAVSVPANIAEGYTRGALRDYLRFLDSARGSLAELEYYLHFLADNGMLESSIHRDLEQLNSEVGNLLVALIRSLRLKLKEGTWDRARLSEDGAEYWPLVTDDSLLPSSSFPLPGEER